MAPTSSRKFGCPVLKHNNTRFLKTIGKMKGWGHSNLRRFLHLWSSERFHSMVQSRPYLWFFQIDSNFQTTLSLFDSKCFGKIIKNVLRANQQAQNHGSDTMECTKHETVRPVSMAIKWSEFVNFHKARVTEILNLMLFEFISYNWILISQFLPK